MLVGCKCCLISQLIAAISLPIWFVDGDSSRIYIAILSASRSTQVTRKPSQTNMSLRPIQRTPPTTQICISAISPSETAITQTDTKLANSIHSPGGTHERPRARQHDRISILARRIEDIASLYLTIGSQRWLTSPVPSAKPAKCQASRAQPSLPQFYANTDQKPAFRDRLWYAAAAKDLLSLAVASIQKVAQ